VEAIRIHWAASGSRAKWEGHSIVHRKHVLLAVRYAASKVVDAGEHIE
jgi:hypothetical protein